MKRGSYVSRSVYQKAIEQNKKLMADIKVMACGEPFEAIQLRQKWRKIFKTQKEMDDMIKEVLLGMKIKINNNQ